ncbi:adenylate cyclase [Haemophilus influenzae]|uniref:Adenylate cyclase n=1 Tax=Haemophilus influenzae TaxID=727 RepID=A0A2X1PJZ2_HAEIF|nr:adenylate cyclase [Haemophilus influenzae]
MPNVTLRVAGKNWQLFFEDRGISLQEIGNESVCNDAESAVDFDEVLQTPIEDGETNQESRPLSTRNGCLRK